MKIPSLFLSAMLLASAARAAGPADFERSLAGIHVLAQGAFKTWHLRPPFKGPPLAWVTDPVTLHGLIERALQENPQSLVVNGVRHQIYVVLSHTAIVGQDCAENAQPLNALYYAVPDKNTGEGIYPIRLLSTCVEPSITRQRLTLIADNDGSIHEMRFYNDTPSSEETAAEEVERQKAYLAALVKLLSETPRPL